MKMKTNSKRLTRAVAIGLAGVLVLSVSAFAAWGSSSGYGKYKDAVTKVFTETENVTIDADTSILYDDDVAFHGEIQYKIDGKNYASHEKSTPTVNTDEYGNEYFSTVIGTTETTFHTAQDYYYQNELSIESINNPLSLGEYGDKVIQFGKLCADTVLGDLKNNVVLVDKKGGVRNYTLDISGDQVPALINSGIDLVMTATGQNGGYVAYEDSDKAFAAYYEKSTGTPLADDYFDVLYGDDSTEDMWEEYNDIYEAMDKEYRDVLEKSGEKAMIYVAPDGSYKVYENYAAYARDTQYGTSNMDAYLDANAVLKNVKFDFALDENDRLVSNDLTITFDQTDAKGDAHKVSIVINVDFSDYGTTKVEPLDVGDRTLYVPEK